MKTVSAIIITALFGLGACAQPGSQSYGRAGIAHGEKTIQILSDPPGARIEVDNDYIGTTPCSIQVRTNFEGNFFQSYHIRALPVGFGYTQEKYFYGSPDGYWKQTIPARIFFEMGLGPVTPQVDVNI